MQTVITHAPPLFGANREESLVAVEIAQRKRGTDEAVLFFREGDDTVSRREPFRSFIVAADSVIADCPVGHSVQPLEGGGTLDRLLLFAKWADCQKAKTWLAKTTGFSPSAPNAPYFFINDPVQQHLTLSGRTLFEGMEFSDLKRMQVDIECLTSEGYDFCNADREGDRIIAIAIGAPDGTVQVLMEDEDGEQALLERFVQTVRDRDPDVIEGHNIFNFDLPYIAARAKRHGVKLCLGRDGSVPRVRPSRFSVGERAIGYERCDIFGRHVVDTLFLVHAYDIANRSLNSFGLKDVAVHFGIAPANREYIDGGRIRDVYREDPRRLERYARDDVVETRELSNLLSRSSFVQAGMLPYSYQNVCVRGFATKIDALMVREYLRRETALPRPAPSRSFAGGYTDMFLRGVVKNVHHCDVRSLYPSLMLTLKLASRSDELRVFLALLDTLRTFRLQAKKQMQDSKTRSERTHFEAMQATFKVLINSFYGYLGFSQARFSDFDAAERVTAEGRALLTAMIEWLRTHGATPVEIDTDGIYFIPPDFGPDEATGRKQEAFRQDFAASLPDGIEIEFDGEFKAMFSYKMKNYALLCEDGEVIIKGAALKSRGLEPFQRRFLESVLRYRLEDRGAEIPKLKAEYETGIRDGTWPIQELAKTERLQDAPATYAAKRGKGARARNAAYELALRSGREYRAGDQISYYVTGTRKSVAVHEYAKPVSEWDPEHRDENVAYYLAKLEALYKKFMEDPGEDEQTELDLGRNS